MDNVPKKSAFRTKSINKFFQSKIGFSEVRPVALEDRSYGLLKINEKSVTPFPRFTDVDLPTLKARLDEQRRKTSNMQDDEHLVEFQSQEHKQDLEVTDWAVGTPHPNKGYALDPKTLLRNINKALTDIRYSSDSSQQLKSALKSSNQPKMKDQKPKKQVRIQLPRKTAILDRRSTASMGASFSSSITYEAPHTLSFNDRRRMLNDNEFAVARYGKKMSDFVMPKHSETVQIDDKDDHQPYNQIDEFIQQKGFIKGQHDIVKNLDVRSFSTESLKQSQRTSNPKKIQRKSRESQGSINQN